MKHNYTRTSVKHIMLSSSFIKNLITRFYASQLQALAEDTNGLSTEHVQRSVENLAETLLLVSSVETKALLDNCIASLRDMPSHGVEQLESSDGIGQLEPQITPSDGIGQLEPQITPSDGIGQLEQITPRDGIGQLEPQITPSDGIVHTQRKIVPIGIEASTGVKSKNDASRL